jgi:acylaminoacyl-peptidase
MDDSKAGPIKEMPLGLDATMEEEYASQSKLLQEFTSISNIDKAWIFKSDGGMASHVYRFFVLQCLVLLSSKPTQPTGVAGNNFLRLKLLLQE